MRQRRSTAVPGRLAALLPQTIDRLIPEEQVPGSDVGGAQRAVRTDAAIGRPTQE